MAIAESWHVRSRGRECAASQRPFIDGETIVTALFPDPESSGYLRRDFCVDGWASHLESGETPFSFWRTTFAAPTGNESAKPEEKLSAEEILSRLVEEDEDHTENARFILAVMLERQKLLRETDSQRTPTGILRVYEHRKTGEVFIVKDPDIPLSQIEAVQQEVFILLENNGRSPDATDPTDETAKPILVGTRGSDLALVQATATEAALAAAFPGREIVRKVITTTGDRRTDVSLADVAKAEGTFDKGVFIKEIEEALEAGEIDIAVHSLKDLPTVLREPFVLAAVLERAPVRDVLVMREPGGLAALPDGAKVGTSSVRRAKQIEWLRPDVTVIDLRGNVPTRLRKLAENGDYDAILLAEAGLVRLDFIPPTAVGEDAEEVNGIPGIFVTRLEESEFFPAAGQGAIGLEVRAGDEPSRLLAETIGHHETWLRIAAEREFLRLLEGGCHTPVGVYSTLSDGEIHLKARVFPEAGGTPQTGEARGTDPISTALELFNSLS